MTKKLPAWVNYSLLYHNTRLHTSLIDLIAKFIPVALYVLLVVFWSLSVNKIKRRIPHEVS